LPETEKLSVELKHPDRDIIFDEVSEAELNFEMEKDPENDLWLYLKNHKELVSFKFDAGGGRTPALPDSVDFKLTDLEVSLRNYYENSPDYSRAINFIKTQGESLKRLRLDGLSINPSQFERLFEPMRVLKSLDLNDFTILPQSTPFASKNFICPALSILDMYRVKEFPFLEKFPNLRVLRISSYSAQPSYSDFIVSAAQHCPRIWKLRLDSFKDLPETTIFPNLVDLTLQCLLPAETNKNFLLQHKLKRLEISGGLDGKFFKEILQSLPKIRHLKFYVDKQLLTDIWPLLGKLKTLEIRFDHRKKGFDINTIRREFPKIPGLKIIDANYY
jgi:hypothetical protein